MTPAGLLVIGVLLLWFVATGRAEALSALLWGAAPGGTLN